MGREREPSPGPSVLLVPSSLPDPDRSSEEPAEAPHAKAVAERGAGVIVDVPLDRVVLGDPERLRLHLLGAVRSAPTLVELGHLDGVALLVELELVPGRIIFAVTPRPPRVAEPRRLVVLIVIGIGIGIVVDDAAAIPRRRRRHEASRGGDGPGAGRGSRGREILGPRARSADARDGQ